jgi:hypothetical protein
MVRSIAYHLVRIILLLGLLAGSVAVDRAITAVTAAAKHEARSAGAAVGELEAWPRKWFDPAATINAPPYAGGRNMDPPFGATNVVLPYVGGKNMDPPYV